MTRMAKTIGRPFKDVPPDPKVRNHRRKAQHIRDKGKKASDAELDWLRRFDLAKSGAGGSVGSPAAPPSATTPPEVKPDEVGTPAEAGTFSPPLEARAVASSAAAPAPVPGLAPAPSAKVLSSPPPRPVQVAPQAPGTAVGAAPVDDSMFKVAAPAVQAARYDALVMIFGQVAEGFEELQVKIERTMQGEKWVMPREFWKGPWLTMTVGLFNRYLPEWMSGPIVEGVTVVMPPVALVRAANQLEKAGYTLGVPGEPGRGAGLAVAAQKAAQAPQAAPGAPEPPRPAEPPQAPPRDAPAAREAKSDSTANPPAKPKNGSFDVRKAFGGN